MIDGAPEPIRVEQAVAQASEAAPRVHRGMMDEENRCARRDLGEREEPLERGELLAAEDAARHERGTGDGARKADDRRRPTQLHERVVAGRQR